LYLRLEAGGGERARGIVEDLLAERGVARDPVEDPPGHGPELLLGRLALAANRLARHHDVLSWCPRIAAMTISTWWS